MSDVNNEIMAINNATIGTGIARMNEVNNGFGYGGGIRGVFEDRFFLAVDYERLTSSSEPNVSGLKLKYDLPSHAIVASAAYLFPGRGNLRFGLGGGLGYYRAGGAAISLDATEAGIPAQVQGDVEASGVGGHAVGILDMALAPAVHLEAMSGFRFANTGDVKLKVSGSPDVTIDGYSLDWSGLIARAGLSFYFGGTQ